MIARKVASFPVISMVSDGTSHMQAFPGPPFYLVGRDKVRKFKNSELKFFR